MLVTSGGNPTSTRKPRKASPGVSCFEPRFVPGLRLSVDGFRIHKESAIISMSATQIVSLESSLGHLDHARGFRAGGTWRRRSHYCGRMRAR